MEEILSRIPCLGQDIFSNLDDESIAQCTEVCRTWTDFIANSKLYWTRKFQKELTYYQCPYEDHGRNCSRNNSCPRKKFTHFDERWKKAIRNASTDIVKELSSAIQLFKDPDYDRFVNGGWKLPFNDYAIKSWTDQVRPLDVVAKCGSVELCKHVIDRIGNENLPDKRGWTPLHYAAISGDVDKFKLFDLQDLHPKTEVGLTPLLMAIHHNHIHICKHIISNMEDKHPETDFPFKVDLYLKYKYKPRNITPLHAAARYGHLEIFKIIFEAAVDNNPACNNGYTPLHYAANNGHLEMCKWIIERIRIKNPANNEGLTPLHLAVKSGHLDVCKWIIKWIDVKNPEDLKGKTPLKIALLRRNFKICKVILKELFYHKFILSEKFI